MRDPIRIGVIGTSWWVELGHLPFLTSDPRSKVVALWPQPRTGADDSDRCKDNAPTHHSTSSLHSAMGVCMPSTMDSRIPGMASR